MSFSTFLLNPVNRVNPVQTLPPAFLVATSTVTLHHSLMNLIGPDRLSPPRSRVALGNALAPREVALRVITLLPPAGKNTKKGPPIPPRLAAKATLLT